MSELIEKSLGKLKENKIPNAELDLRILLNHASNKKNEIFLSNFNIKDINIKLFRYFLSKRLNYEPIAKILNEKYFWKHKFYVNHHVLDPRPETELIIEETLKNIKNKNQKISILDVGTGSGCLAISLATELPNAKITAIDISIKATDVARKNIIINKVGSQINVINCSIEDINEKYDFIVSNPPYISENEYNDLSKEIKKYEPKIALIGGKDGLFFYRNYANHFERLMKKDSYLVIEIGNKQLDSCKSIFEVTNLKLKKISKDINKIDRTLTFLKI